MTGAVVDVTAGGKYLVLLIARSDPLQIDQLRGEELRQRLLNIVVSIDGEHPKRSWRIVAAVLHHQRQIVKEINCVTAGVQKRTDVVGEPEAGKNVHVRFARGRGKVSLGYEHRQACGNSVIVPDLHDVTYQLRFFIKTAPGNSARIERIVFEGEKCEIAHSLVLLQIIDEPPGPRDLSVHVGPDFDVLIHALERWPA